MAMNWPYLQDPLETSGFDGLQYNHGGEQLDRRFVMRTRMDSAHS